MAHSIEKQRKALQLVDRAALAWWEHLRPIGWGLPEHLENPTVNTRSGAEHALAAAVAAAVNSGAI